MKFTIFNGPLEEFEKILPPGNYTTLTPMVQKLDLERNGRRVEDEEEYDALIVYSDEYSGVLEHFIESFLIQLVQLSYKYDYDQVFLHNPPTRIIQQLESPSFEYEKEVINHQHQKPTLESLKEIRDRFDDVVFGQEKVKFEILRTLYRLTNNGNHKPVVIMMYGPPGVGKTEAAKLINEILNEKSQLLRKQLSMFHNESFSSYIFGNRASSFAKDLVDRKTNVILLDEFDKSNPLFYSAFYQMFDEGVFSDKYYEVNLDNAIILCTSNYQNEEEIKYEVGSAIYSRFDNLIKFDPLSIEAKYRIIERTYERELLNLNEADREFLADKFIVEKMKKFADKFENARQIQKKMKQIIAIPLIERL